MSNDSWVPGRELDEAIYQRLFERRTLLLGESLEQRNSNRLYAGLLLLAADNPDTDIRLCSSRDGPVTTAGIRLRGVCGRPMARRIRIPACPQLSRAPAGHWVARPSPGCHPDGLGTAVSGRRPCGRAAVSVSAAARRFPHHPAGRAVLDHLGDHPPQVLRTRHARPGRTVNHLEPGEVGECPAGLRRSCQSRRSARQPSPDASPRADASAALPSVEPAARDPLRCHLRSLNQTRRRRSREPAELPGGHALNRLPPPAFCAA